MNPILQLLALALATLLAAAAAVAVDWLLLRAAFRLMRPAVAARGLMRPSFAQGKAELARGTVLLARAFNPRR